MKSTVASATVYYKNKGNGHISYSVIQDDAMDETLEARYSEILAGLDPSFVDHTQAKGQGLSTPFLVNGPKDPDTRRIMALAGSTVETGGSYSPRVRE